MERLSALLLSLLCLYTGPVFGDETFEYDDQAAWPGICNVGNTGHQSPINIITANVVEDSSLSALMFSSSWGEAVTNGEFANLGHSVQLTLDENSPSVTTEMPVGDYRLLQVHFHWGNRSGSGSEHLINGEQAELEAHFVHGRVSSGGDSGNQLAVIGVLADMTTDPISGVWETLETSQLTEPHGNISITNFTLTDLLPANRDYYHYPGSLTTPPCTESVQWFVLKNRITVPIDYLNAIQMIRSESGQILDFNFRMPQPLGDRTVSTPESSALITSSSLLTVFSLAILIIAGLY